MKIQPAHQTTGSDNPSCSQLASGIDTSIPIPGMWPASSVTGRVNANATQNRRRMSRSIVAAMAGSAIMEAWSWCGAATISAGGAAWPP
ncbi:MAG TPA: hypothetical protein PK948_07140 [Gemmatimonadales bacterium]|nr:hypothetical protein [Gemmatimonadales bacterium]